MIDDLTTTGSTKFEAIQKLVDAGLNVKDIVVLIDRESGAKELLAKEGYTLHAIFSLVELVTHLEGQGKISADQVSKVMKFIQDTAPK